MKCENCIHSEICKIFDCQGISEKSPCSFFKDQNKFIELPYKVGDTLYTNLSIQGDYFQKKNRPYSCRVVFIGINGGECFVNTEYVNGRQYQFFFKDFGEKIFLTKEEAKQALKGGTDNE